MQHSKDASKLSEMFFYDLPKYLSLSVGKSYFTCKPCTPSLPAPLQLSQLCLRNNEHHQYSLCLPPYQDSEQFPNRAGAVPLVGAVLEAIQEVTVGSMELSDAVEHGGEVIRRYHGLRGGEGGLQCLHVL